MLIFAFIKTQEYVVLKDTFSLAFYIIKQLFFKQLSIMPSECEVCKAINVNEIDGQTLLSRGTMTTEVTLQMHARAEMTRG